MDCRSLSPLRFYNEVFSLPRPNEFEERHYCIGRPPSTALVLICLRLILDFNLIDPHPHSNGIFEASSVHFPDDRCKSKNCQYRFEIIISPQMPDSQVFFDTVVRASETIQIVRRVGQLRPCLYLEMHNDNNSHYHQYYNYYWMLDVLWYVN